MNIENVQYQNFNTTEYIFSTITENTDIIDKNLMKKIVENGFSLFLLNFDIVVTLFDIVKNYI